MGQKRTCDGSGLNVSFPSLSGRYAAGLRISASSQKRKWQPLRCTFSECIKVCLVKVDMVMRLLATISVLLGIACLGTAAAEVKCNAHTLSPGGDSVAAPSAAFFMKNNGPKPVVIVTDADKSFRKRVDAGKATVFSGDHRFSYSVRPATPGDTTTIEFCRKVDADVCNDLLAKRNYTEASVVCRQAADQGNTAAQNSLGSMYSQGHGVQRDHAEAAKWYRKAAEGGNALGQFNLGASYHEGRGVGQNFVEAAKWYRRAAEQGNPQAQHNLGVLYYTGQAGIKDKVKAYMLLELAAALGDDMSARDRHIVGAEIEFTEIHEARRLTRECEDKNFKGCGF